MEKIHKITYRSDIDGLRAIAVMGVVLCHFGLGFEGGYVGVDVFFVISGFLITSILLRQIAEKSFSMWEFWERRARRILPALFVVVLVTVVAGWCILLPTDYKELGKSVGALAVFASNVLFYRGSGYFSNESDLHPLLHTWSLAVEEQFYLLFPLLVTAVMKLGRKVLLTVLGILTILSLAWSVHSVAVDMDAAFYLLPSRFWELALGALAALLTVPNPQWEGTRIACGRGFWSFLGLVLILVPMLLYHADTPFPGISAIPPCLGAVMIIGLNTETRTRASQWLGARPLVFIGAISYSLYLWHWPLIVLIRHWFYPGEVPLSIRIPALVVSLILASVSWRYVEKPFRSKQRLPRPAVFLASASALLLFLACGSAIYLRAGFQSRFSDDVVKYNCHPNSSTDRNYDSFHVRKPEVFRRGKCPVLGQGGSVSKVLFWGDSHMEVILSAVEAACDNNKTSVYAGYRRASPPLLGVYRGQINATRSMELNREVVEFVRREEIRTVVLGGRWSAYCEPDLNGSKMWVEDGSGEPQTADKARVIMKQAILNTINAYRSAGASVYILKEVPQQKCDLPRGMARCQVKGIDVGRLRVARVDHLKRQRFLDSVFDEIALLPNVVVIDQAKLLVDPVDGNHFLVQYMGEAAFRDDNHLSRSGAGLMVPIFDRILNSIDHFAVRTE